MLLNLIIFLISCIILAKSSQIIIKTLSKLAIFLRLTEFSIGFILMAIATTLPELFVGINSALKNNTALSLGNVLGSNIVNLSLILGIVIILSKNIDTKSKIIEKNIKYMFFISLIPMLFMLDHIISRLEGLVLILIFIIYIYKVSKERKPEQKITDNSSLDLYKNFGLFFLGISLLILSANFVVGYGTKLAIDLFVPPILIGLFMIAIGTSLPELAFGVKASLKKHPKMSLGNLTGASIVNSTLVLGATAIIKPITANFKLFLIASLFLIIINTLYLIFIKTNKKLTINEGIILIIIYISFLITELMIK